MARTVYFPDGTMEVVLCDAENTEGTLDALERIIWERLGDDTVSLLHDATNPVLNGIEALKYEMSSYERFCDHYQAMLQDVRDELEEMLKMLNAKRLNRKELQLSISRLSKQINDNL